MSDATRRVAARLNETADRAAVEKRAESPQNALVEAAGAVIAHLATNEFPAASDTPIETATARAGIPIAAASGVATSCLGSRPV